MIEMEYRIPADAKCIGRDRKRGLALITFSVPDPLVGITAFAETHNWVRRWFADDPSLHHVTWYDDAMERDSTEVTRR